MNSWDALKKCIGKGVERFEAVADYVGVHSSSTIYKWTQPYKGRGSGNKNPLQVVKEIIELSLAEGTSPDKATAPIRYLSECFDLILIPTPNHPVTYKRITQDLIDTIKEFSDLTQASATALADREITLKEAEHITKEGMELLRQVATYMEHIKGVIKNEII